jgi:hypothetical protein
MKRFLFLMLCVSANTVWAQNEAKPAVIIPIQCLVTHIDADKDPKPVLLPNEDKYAFEKRQGEWQRREEQRNPKVETPTVNLPIENQLVTTLKVRTNPIKKLIEDGVTTVEQLKQIAPNMPLMLGTNDQTNEKITIYREVELVHWAENYPREVERFYNTIIPLQQFEKLFQD